MNEALKDVTGGWNWLLSVTLSSIVVFMDAGRRDAHKSRTTAGAATLHTPYRLKSRRSRRDRILVVRRG